MNTVAQPAIIPLYEGDIPNSKPVANGERTVHSGGIDRVSDISVPTMAVYAPPAGKANGAAVIIFPGGGYGIVAITHEGTDVARQLNDWGITAFVVKYRMPNNQWMHDKSVGPLQDAQQAIKRVREGAARWQVDPARVGILGFSAGGHLAAMAGTQFGKAYIANTAGTSLRPDFMILAYPVISFADSLTHMGSRNNLLGSQPSAAQVAMYSNELHVTGHTPPTFLLHATDDGAVKVANSLVFYQALLRQKVKAEMHLYQTGGHGFGMRIPGSDDLWLERCRNWMRASGWLP